MGGVAGNDQIGTHLRAKITTNTPTTNQIGLMPANTSAMAVNDVCIIRPKQLSDLLG